jgi:hypothetical protein
LEWIFTSADWTTEFPNTTATPLARLGLDYIPILIQVNTTIHKSNIFRSEEYWLEFEEFQNVVQQHWVSNGLYKGVAHDLVAGFKSLRNGIKKWSKKLSNLTVIIENCSYVIAMNDGLEDQRNLSIIEKFVRKAVKQHQIKLLEAKRIYWRKRANIRWAQLGDENTKFFHAIATRNYRHNFIASLHSDEGIEYTDHEQKAAILWNAFKNRLGKTEEYEMMFDLANLITPVDLSSVEVPFTHEEIDGIIKLMPNDKAPGPDGFNGLFMKRF